MRAIALTAAAALFASSAQAELVGDPAAAASVPRIVTPADNGKTFLLTIGQCLDVRLSSNAGSTGYQWFLAPGMSEVMSLAARTVTAPSQPMPGAPSTLDFILCAANKGEAVVKFANFRPWEKNAKPAQELVFTVKVTP